MVEVRKSLIQCTIQEFGDRGEDFEQDALTLISTLSAMQPEKMGTVKTVSNGNLFPMTCDIFYARFRFRITDSGQIEF